MNIKTLRIVWGAIVAGAAIVIGILTFLSQQELGAFQDNPEFFFYLNAALSMGSIVAGFVLQRKIPNALQKVKNTNEGVQVYARWCILSIAIMEFSALVAGVFTLLSSQIINLAFAVPFFAFAWLFFPTDSRVTSLFREANLKNPLSETPFER